MHQNKSEFVEIGRSDGDWSVLYLDKSDGRYWELIYPCGNQRDGDAPSLEPCVLGEVTDKYKTFVSD
jgi:hypothetical protein